MFINLSGVMAIRVQINVFGRTQCVLTKRVEKFFAPTKSVFIRIIFGRFFTKIPVNFPLIYLWLIRGNYSQIHLFYRCSSTLRVSRLKCYGVLFGRTRCVPTKGAKNVSHLQNSNYSLYIVNYQQIPKSEIRNPN